MSDERERDAIVIAEMRGLVEFYDTKELPGQYYGTGEGFRIGHNFNVAALRTIDRLTAERDAARAELAKLRNVIGILTFNMRDVSNMLIGMCQQYAYLKIAPDTESEADHD